ncbi:phage tail fiber domain-containing protein [Agrobacterium deltaense]|uniref:phage tail fiber domain-containing protein n=1 Tax=Agrobacterium deltaense TaxID=1183412 RepID=UPI003FD57066
MPLSYAHSSGDGSNRLFDVPCEYLSKSHVTVRVDGVLVPFSWIDTYRLQTTTAPPSGAVVEVRRVTPRVDRLVTFTDGSTLVQSDLNTSTLQSFFLAQEAFDQGAASMAVTEDGQFSALNRRITSLANPINEQDAVTKLWAETAMSSQLVQATQKALDAAASAAQSANSAVTSDNRAASALASKNAAASSASDAAQSASYSFYNKNQTQLDSAATAADRVQTGLDRSAAAASAAAAKKSAEDAAMFDPATYYTKVQIDGSFYTKAIIDTKLAGYATTGALSTAVGQKLSKTGDTMTGTLTLQPPTGASMLEMRAVTGQACAIDFSANGYSGDFDWRVINNPEGFLDIVRRDKHVFRFNTDGNLWTAHLGWVSDRFADRGARVWHDGGIWEFGAIDPNYNALTADAPAPYVLIGLRSSRGTNTINLRAIQLRNN